MSAVNFALRSRIPLISVRCELRRWRMTATLWSNASQKTKLKNVSAMLDKKLEAAGKSDETVYDNDTLNEWKRSVETKMELLHGTKGKPGSWPAFPPIGDGA